MSRENVLLLGDVLRQPRVESYGLVSWGTILCASPDKVEW